MNDYERVMLEIEKEKLKEMKRTNEINKTSILSALAIWKCFMDTFNKMIKDEDEDDRSNN